MSAHCHECPDEGSPDWIMSFADMVTILMAFFVVMYSMAPTGNGNARVDAVLRSLRHSFGPFEHVWATSIYPRGSILGNPGALPLDPAWALDDEGRRRRSPRAISEAPAASRPVGTTITFRDLEVKMSEAQRQALATAIEHLAGKPQRIEVRGHVPRAPLQTGSEYQDQWDLAYARCRSVMAHLVSSGIDPKRIRLSVTAWNRISDEATADRSDGPVPLEVFMLNEFIDGSTEPDSRSP